jgi:hypothetical protein
MKPAPNPRQVVVHFGMPKTGTTSIQLSLSRRLSDPRFHYVKFAEGDSNYAIATGFRTDPTRDRRHLKLGTPSHELPRLRKSIVRQLRASLEQARERTAILSAEIIAALKEAEFRELHAVLAGSGGRVTAVGYVRRPKETMESEFQQQVKSGRQAFGMERLFPNYRARVKKLDAVLGSENTHIWRFDPSSFPGGCVVLDFCARMGISFRPEDVIRFNDGLSRPALSLLYAYRKFGPGYGVGPQVIRENRLLIQGLRALPGPKVRFHSSLVEPVIERRGKVVRWMESRLHASLAEDLSEHDETAIRSEEDLLAFTPESLRWLAHELGPEHSERWRPGMTPPEVAQRMHQLRVRLAAESGEERDSVAKSR